MEKVGNEMRDTIEVWNGTSWSYLGGGTDLTVWSHSVAADSNGPALLAGGPFASAGVTPAHRIAKWNGTSWSALGSGVDGAVRAMTEYDDGYCNGPALFAGGDFLVAPDSGDSYLAKWDCTPKAPTPGCFDAYCFGDGIDPNVTTACPCGNFGAPGHGCANSADPNGARLVATGAANPDTIVLHAGEMPSVSSCIYLQGDGSIDAVYGDGVRCARGNLVRLRTRTNVGGASEFPDSTDTVSLSQRGGVVNGSGVTRYYQTYYRNASAAFCPPATFNITNGWRVVW